MVKWPGHEADHSPPSSTAVEECVELYIHSLNTRSWRVAYLSTGTTLHLPLPHHSELSYLYFHFMLKYTFKYCTVSNLFSSQCCQWIWCWSDLSVMEYPHVMFNGSGCKQLWRLSFQSVFFIPLVELLHVAIFPPFVRWPCLWLEEVFQ
jgi:hypothetical protein